jgi:hypothetical protein
VAKDTAKLSYPRQLQFDSRVCVLYKELPKCLANAVAFSGDLVSLVVGNIKFVLDDVLSV